MKFPSIVCPPLSDVFQGFRGHSVLLQASGLAGIAECAEAVRTSGNSLFCIIVDPDRTLADLEIPDGLESIPLAIRAPAMGRYADIAPKIPKLGSLNLRVYLPCHSPDNLIALRILSSVGIHCCADFTDGRVDWDSLADLSTYALLGLTPHAPVEPFASIASNYRPASSIDWGRAVFDDPRHFLYLDADGRVALSREDLAGCRFVAERVDDIQSPGHLSAIREYGQSWRAYFRDNHPCASCAGWRLCQGRFSRCIPEDRGCSIFFDELADVAREHLRNNAAPPERTIWQP
jgi:hypothetical protein